MEKAIAEDLIRRLMVQHRIADWTFKWNRNKHFLGICKYDARRIELSEVYVSMNSFDHVRDTILHEIAHALAGPEAKHGPLWKATAMRLGAHPKSCAGDAVMPKGRWQALCKTCGREFSKHRKPKRVRSHYCRRCGPDSGRLWFRDSLLIDMTPLQVVPDKSKKPLPEPLPATQVPPVVVEPLPASLTAAVSQLRIQFPA
jgi:predicted SprT family Zn-dependent metalloprotease